MPQLAIPNKLFFRIGEVCKLLNLEAYVLRFWEKEFPMLSPTKGANGRRMYRKKDVEMVITIRNLLYSQGFTIAGARKVLMASGTGDVLAQPGDGREPVETDSPSAKPVSGQIPSEKLLQFKADLREILTILNRRC
jgi:DNA-binding transcriptional MerR regulator